MLRYGLTIFTGAFLLFAVQPLIAKAILPWFGGSASVWTTCMLFFQVVLLLGYLYTHWSIGRLAPRRQAMVHIALLAASLVLLPVSPSPRWKPVGHEDPILRILLLLATTVGLPYFLLSTTGPLVQAWCARDLRHAVPYRLYSLSNLGSMLALLSYPVLVEPLVTIRGQITGWSAAYALFVLLCGALAWRNRSVPAPDVVERESQPPNAAPSWKMHALWLVLAACPSMLLLAVTNHLCQNLAAIPFLWILPLSLYLASFIICFDHPRWYHHDVYYWLLVGALGVMTYGLLKIDANASLKVLIPVFAAGLFVCCMFCHGELAARKPHPRYLTHFYLMVATGGALGGLAVGLGAPTLFKGYFELPVAITACGALALFLIYGRRVITDVAWVAITVGLVVAASVEIRAFTSTSRVMMRSFYGGLRVVDLHGQGEDDATRTLAHGVINHGTQFLAPHKRREPTAYFGPQSGAGVAVRFADRSPLHVGIIGLGAGTLAVYGRRGDTYRFYEINPQVIELARREFSFLEDCEAQVEVVLGDARLSLEREPPRNFDVFVVDAFSGDSIPVHLVTREAFELYLRHLKPDGVLTLHISNSYLDLVPVVRRLAQALGRPSRLVVTTDDEPRKLSGSVWMIVTSNTALLAKAGLGQDNVAAPARPISLWTDDYSNQFQILK